MRFRLRDAQAGWWLAALAAAAGLAWAGLTGFAWNDYDDEASPAFRALIDGRVHDFLAGLPAYGGSFVLRAPFAALAAAAGGGELAVYRAVSIPCLLAAVVLGIVLVRRLRDRDAPTSTIAVALGLCVANPVTLRALEMGHAEELLTAVLAVGAVLAACERRELLAAVLLGLAVASKLWAVLAVGPVLLALPAHRVRALAIAGGVGAAVLAPMLLEGSGGGVVSGAAQTGPTIFQPWQLFWPLGEHAGPVHGLSGQLKPGYRTPPDWLSPIAHPLIALLVVPLSALWWRRRRRHGAAPEQVLLLLALLLLLRCVLDPWNTSYYALPFLLALLAWETLCRTQRPPVLALVGTVLVWVTFQWLPGRVTPDVQCALYLAWTVPLAGWMARQAFAASSRRPAFERALRSGRSMLGEIRVRPGARVG